MFEIFMAICALTMLECGNVTVAYETLPNQNWHAVAGYDSDGNYYILVNTNLDNKSDKFMQRLMVHEISHLVAFDIDPSNVTHYGAYRELCRRLAEQAEVTGRYTCSPYSGKLPPWSHGSRR